MTYVDVLNYLILNLANVSFSFFDLDEGRVVIVRDWRDLYCISGNGMTFVVVENVPELSRFQVCSCFRYQLPCP